MKILEEKTNEIAENFCENIIPISPVRKNEAINYFKAGAAFMEVEFKNLTIEVLEWITRQDSPYAILYSLGEQRFATTERDYTCDELFDLFIEYKIKNP